MGPESDQLLSRAWILGLQDKTHKVGILSFPHPCILQNVFTVKSFYIVYPKQNAEAPRQLSE